MTQHTVSAFDNDLTALAAGVSSMGAFALDQVSDAVKAVASGDATLAEQVIERDARLDRMETDVEQMAVRLIALRQPMAEDLRTALAALKIATNLERCGDLAKNIAKRTLVMHGAEATDPTRQSLEHMGRLVAARLGEVLTAFGRQDVAGALAVWRRDTEIDAQYDSLFRALLTYMMSDPQTITTSAHLLFVAKNLERIGDHATNIAEEVYYQLTGDAAPGTSRPKWDSLRPEDATGAKP